MIEIKITTDGFFLNSKIKRTKENEEIFEFLIGEYSISRMQFCCELGIPALSGIVTTLESKFNKHLASKYNRRNIGWMIKHIMTKIGYKTIKRGRLPKRLNSKYFINGSIYNYK